MLITIALLSALANSPDPLADEIHRWSEFLKSDKSNSEAWSQVKPAVAPVITRAEDALRDGRRLLALQRFVAARTNLEAAAYAAARSDADRKDEARFEAEWKRLAPLATKQPSIGDIEPAALRAYTEASIPQVRAFYEASLEYGRSTMAEAGFFYLGAAQAQRDFGAFARRVAFKTGKRPPSLRSIDSDLSSLERELLAAYRPPTAIDKHSEFIGASSMVKEARELDAAGLRYGALVSYLEAARRTALINGPTLPSNEIADRLHAFEERMAGDVDHTIGQIYVEAAHADPAAASAIVSSVLPRYFAALEPAKSVSRPAPKVTVTLVRWPYT